MQKIERKAMAQLLEEYKTAVAQRDQLLIKQNEYAEEVVTFKVTQCHKFYYKLIV